MERTNHWESVWERSDPTQVSWFQSSPDDSLRFIEAADLPKSASILDVGGGASTLVDSLLDDGYGHIGVLDVSARAIGLSRERLGSRADTVEWYVGDVTRFRSPHPWDLWHDRAVLHFLTEAADQAAYREALLKALAPAGQAVIASFGPDGPLKCSGLDVQRHGTDSLLALLGPELELVQDELIEHTTPGGTVQQFFFGRFRRAF